MFAEERSPASRTELNPDKAFGGLTSKQAKFATLVFSGRNYTEAYREVFDCSNMLETTVQGNAWAMAQKPLVVAKLKELSASRDNQTSLVSSLSRDWITNGIMRIAEFGDKDSTKLAAYVALGKVVGIDLFRETVRTEKVVRTPEEADKELKRLLGEMMVTIEGEATEVAPASQPSRKPAPTQDPTPRDRRRKPKPR